MKIFTTEASRAVDTATINSGHATAMQLIEEVAEGAAAQIRSRWNPSTPTIVFAGSGGNGADALATARLLSETGFRPAVFLFNIGGRRLTPEALTARDMLLAACPDVEFVEITERFQLPELSRDMLVIDGLFGSGLRDSLTGGFLALVRKINESEASVVSLDVPSGLRGDWNPEAVERDIIHADLSIGVGTPRIAFLLDNNAPMVGDWTTVDLSLSPKVIRNTPSDYYFVERRDIAPLLPQRHPFSSKHDFGHALLVAGSSGMAGAAVLAANGALRGGVGRLTVRTPRACVPVLQTAVPEACCSPDSGRDFISEIPLASRFDVIAIGPGLGTDSSTTDAVERFIRTHKVRMVLDADALNCIARRPQLLNFLTPNTIITPHAGEFDRLFGSQPSAEARLLKAMEVARQYKIIVVLKGRYTATVRPDGHVYFNSTGSPALATPGSGDVLTGLITALLCQIQRPEFASAAAVYLHGLAGEISARRLGEYSVLASDVANAIPEAIIQTTR